MHVPHGARFFKDGSILRLVSQMSPSAQKSVVACRPAQVTLTPPGVLPRLMPKMQVLLHEKSSHARQKVLFANGVDQDNMMLSIYFTVPNMPSRSRVFEEGGSALPKDMMSHG